MKTYTILIGNSDQKLKQYHWSALVEAMTPIIMDVTRNYAGSEVHFRGFSPSESPYQNAAWVIQLPDEAWPLMADRLARLASRWSQDSIAVVIGETQFIKALR